MTYLEQLCAKHLRGKGWTCVAPPPADPVPPSEPDDPPPEPPQPPAETRRPLTDAQVSAALANAHQVGKAAVKAVTGKSTPTRKVRVQIVPGIPSSRPNRYKIPVPGMWAGAYIDGPWKANGNPKTSATYTIYLAGRADGLYTPAEVSALRGNLSHEMGHAYTGRYHLAAYDAHLPGWKQARAIVGE